MVNRNITPKTAVYNKLDEWIKNINKSKLNVEDIPSYTFTPKNREIIEMKIKTITLEDTTITCVIHPTAENYTNLIFKIVLKKLFGGVVVEFLKDKTVMVMEYPPVLAKNSQNSNNSSASNNVDVPISDADALTMIKPIIDLEVNTSNTTSGGSTSRKSRRNKIHNERKNSSKSIRRRLSKPA